ncbi:MAG: hypothetical protein FJX76_21885, partial [Armatimonadetes bacterium]|nr:hypothetical protein [Armatimonadota bacterium]
MRLLCALFLLIVVAAGPAWSAPAAPDDDAPGLNFTQPTSDSEAKSGLLKNDVYPLSTVLLRLVAYEAATELLGKLDESIGDNTLGRVILGTRLLGIAEVLGACSEVLKEGEKALPAVAAANAPDLLLEYELLLTQAGRDAGRPDVARRHRDAAAALAEKLQTPTARLARFVVASFAFEEEFRKNPNLSMQELLRRHDETFGMFEAVPEDVRVAPFIMGWVGEAARVWMLALIDRGKKLPENSPESQEILKRFESDVMLLTNRGVKRSDMEMLIAAVEGALDAARAMREAGEPRVGLALIDEMSAPLAASDAQFVELLKSFDANPYDSSIARVRARLLQEKALLLLSADPAKNAKLSMQLLERAHIAFEKGEDNLALVDTENAIGRALFLLKPPRWQKLAAETLGAALKRSSETGYRRGRIRSLANLG